MGALSTASAFVEHCRNRGASHSAIFAIAYAANNQLLRYGSCHRDRHRCNRLIGRGNAANLPRGNPMR